MQLSPNMQGFKLPAVIDPPDSICFQIPVPNDPAHLQAFIGVLFDLTLWNSWQRDPLRRGVRAAQVWKRIWTQITASYPNCPDIAIPIAESDYIMSICEQLRFQDGQLQALCCGEWTNISGQPVGGIGGGGQPGPGAPVPPPNGGCQVYHAVLNGNDQWLSPAAVNAGDTVQISNLQGAWSDGAGLWYCAEGQVYFAGACTVTTLDALDPLPAVGHMALLSKIAGTFANVSGGGLMTVPGGVANALLIFQANDSTLSDNYGQITFDVTVCNNRITQFTHHFDFRTGTFGFQINTYGGVSNAAWMPGSGYAANNTSGSGSGNGAIDLTLNNHHSLAHCKIRVVGSNTSGASSYGGYQQIGDFPPQTVGEAHTDTVQNGAVDFTTPVFAATLQQFAGLISSGPLVGQVATLTDLYVTADGADPF